MRLDTKYGPVTLVESNDDLDAFEAWVRSAPVVAIDTETTGLDIYSPTHQLRLVQFGSADQAWVLDAARYAPSIRQTLAWLIDHQTTVVMHNASYDVLVLARHGFVDLSDIYTVVHDTRTMLHLLDPRAQQEGGRGHGLKANAAHYVDPDAPDGDLALKELFKANGWKASDGWSKVPTDDETYVRYAGLDVLLTSRLYQALAPLVDRTLFNFEMRVQAACARMQHRGVLLDVSYANSLTGFYDTEEAEGAAAAAQWGIANVNSPQQVAEVLLALGAELTDTTPSGAAKVDKHVLRHIADAGGAAGEVAAAVLRAKQAGKFRTAYVDTCLSLRDSADRVHPWINSLKARTARMSIDTPPLQQLPSGDWRLRRMFLADPGMAIISVDYSQIELRVLAAMAEEHLMIDAINGGRDLHDVTATALFGEGFTKQQRKLAKNVGFGRVYGGGAFTLARQAGVDEDTAKRAMLGYDAAFPGIKRFSKRLEERARAGVPEVVTPAGRHLPLDRDRYYSATNYMVQSTARDVLANSLLELEAAGLGDYLLLPIHDEVLAQAPVADAADIAKHIAEAMTVPFGPVMLTAEPEVYGPSWGHGYGAPP